MFSWLRGNAQYYLLVDAQRQVATRYGMPGPNRPSGIKERFWLQVFAPTFRILPDRVRTFAIQALPGSHRQDWPKPESRRRTPAL